MHLYWFVLDFNFVTTDIPDPEKYSILSRRKSTIVGEKEFAKDPCAGILYVLQIASHSFVDLIVSIRAPHQDVDPGNVRPPK